MRQDHLHTEGIEAGDMRDEVRAGGETAQVGKENANSAPLRAILDRVIVRPDPPLECIGRIHLPEETQAEAKGQIGSGTVVAVGPGAVRDVRCDRCNAQGCDHCRGTGHIAGHFRATELKPGDRVEIGRYGEGRAAVEFRHDGVDYLVLREDDVIGKYVQC